MANNEAGLVSTDTLASVVNKPLPELAQPLTEMSKPIAEFVDSLKNQQQPSTTPSIYQSAVASPGTTPNKDYSSRRDMHTASSKVTHQRILPKRILLNIDLQIQVIYSRISSILKNVFGVGKH